MKWKQLSVLAALTSMVVCQQHPSLEQELNTPLDEKRPHGDGKGGDTKKVVLEVTESHDSLDGDSKRKVYAINGRPFNGGDAIYLDEDQEIEIEVINNVAEDGPPTTLHAHGIEQISTQFNDGVPGVSQTLINPGQNFIYRWRAENQYGLYWLHSHFAGLYQDGQAFPLYIRPKRDRKTPFHLISDNEKHVDTLTELDKDPKIVMISDYSQLTSAKQSVKVEEWNSEIFNSVLLNGKGRVNCPAIDDLKYWTNDTTVTAKGCLDRSVRPQYENITFDDEIWYDCEATDEELTTFEFNYDDEWGVMSFVSASSHWSWIVSIDEHELFVYSADGSYHKPLSTEAFTLSVGERLNFAFKLHTPGEYVLRVSAYEEPQVIGQFAIIRYGLDDDDDSVEYTDPEEEGSSGMPSLPTSEPYINYAGQVVDGSVRVLNSLDLKQYDPSIVPKRAEAADVTLHFKLANQNFLQWSMSQGGELQYFNATNEYIEPPILYDMDKYIDEDNDMSIASFNNGSIVDIVIISGEEYGDIQPPHPIHKHFEHTHVIAYGIGNFTYNDIIEAEQNGIDVNWNDPPYKDTYYTPQSTAEAPSYLVLRYQAKQVTASLIHCHITSHQMSGMSYVLMSKEDEEQPPEMPNYYLNQAFNSDFQNW